MSQIDFKTSSYFTSPLYFSGWVFLLVAPLVMFNTIISGLIIVLVGVTVLTTHYRLKINFDTKMYYEYIWILGLRKNYDKTKFKSIEYLFIKKNKFIQTTNRFYIPSSSTIRYDVFGGYIKFSEKLKIRIGTKDHRKNLIEKLRPLAARLNVRIIDYSDGEPKEI